jgi:hypothetical protein
MSSFKHVLKILILFTFTIYPIFTNAALLSEIPKSVYYSSEVTKKQHAIFWNEINSMSQDDAESFITMYRNTTVYGLEVQVAIWTELLHSNKTGNATIPDGLAKLIKKLNTVLIEQFKSKLNLPKESKNFISAVNKMEAVMQDNMEATKQLFIAAATKGVILSEDGSEIDITKELIEQTLSGLELKFTALNKLLNKTWVD